LSLLINKKKYSSLHFVGILGSGMSAIAQYLTWSSVQVSGSDRLINTETTKYIQDTLESIGCRIYKQDGSGIMADTEGLVLSTAIEDSNPDIAKARRNNIPVFHRSDVLAAIVNTKKTIAVAGTSGKSTVAALTFHLLSSCGKKPSLISGGNLNELVERGFIGNAYHDTSDLLVIEADESDGSLVKYKPYISIFLNLSKDHKPVTETLQLFHSLAKQSSHVFCNYDDRSLRSIQPTQRFGLNNKADLFPDTTKLHDTSSSLILGKDTFTTPFPGKYSLYNLLAALTICKFLDCDSNSLSKSSETYKGIQRRFNCYKTAKGVTIIDDYAHNPEKINAILETVQNISPVIYALFQPHGFAPTRFLLPELIEVFKNRLRESDVLYLLPIYYAGGTVNKDISSMDIAEGLHPGRGEVITPGHRDDVISHIASRAKPGDIVISMGARDPSLPEFARSIAAAIDK